MYSSEEILENSSLVIRTRNGDINDEYTIKMDEVIGRGTYGRVHLACGKSVGQGLRLVKMIDRSQIGFPLLFYNEVENLRNLSHKNVLKIYEIYKSKDYYYILTQFCKQTFFQYLQNQGSSYNQIQLNHYFRMMLDAVNFCHQQNISHRQIKLQSFLVQHFDNNICLKLVNFFSSYKWKQNMKLERKGKKDRKIVQMTPYTSPQVLKGEEDESCDIWSLGIILYVMTSGQFPFQDESDEKMGQKILEGKYKQLKSVNPQLKDLISHILVPDYKRLCLEEIYNHPWIKTKPPQHKFSFCFEQIMMSADYYRSQMEVISIFVKIFSIKTFSQFEQSFKEHDPKKEGRVNVKIFETIFKGGQKNEQINFFLRMCSLVRDGSVNYKQLTYYFHENAICFREENLIMIFKRLDRKKEGKVKGTQLLKQLEDFNEDFECDVIRKGIQFCRTHSQNELSFLEYCNLFPI